MSYADWEALPNKVTKNLDGSVTIICRKPTDLEIALYQFKMFSLGLNGIEPHFKEKYKRRLNVEATNLSAK